MWEGLGFQPNPLYLNVYMMCVNWWNKICPKGTHTVSTYVRIYDRWNRRRYYIRLLKTFFLILNYWPTISDVNMSCLTPAFTYNWTTQVKTIGFLNDWLKRKVHLSQVLESPQCINCNSRDVYNHCFIKYKWYGTFMESIF